MDAINKLNFGITNSTPVILQTEIAECGLASIAMIASYFGHKIDINSIRQYSSAGLNGMNLQQLIDVANKLGLASRALQCPVEEMNKLTLPCILHWDMNHFVVLTKVSNNNKNLTFSIIDPATGKGHCSLEEFQKHYTGICLELTPTNKFQTRQAPPQMKLSQLWSSLIGFKSNLIKLIALSITIQVFTLITPYYMQWVVDEVLVGFDIALLSVLAIGFAAVALLSVVTNAIRSWLILRVSSMSNVQMGVNLFHHLLQLPMSYFEARHIGDVVSRFSSLNFIRERITTGVVETFIDGVMALTIVVIMWFYSWQLCLLVIGAICIYTLIRLFFYPSLHQASEQQIQCSAKEQSNFLENIRAIQTIKLFANESQRQNLWQNKYVDVINSEIKLGRLTITFDSFNKLLFGLENVIVIYLAALLVIENLLTIGMVLAFIAYKQQLITRTTHLVEQIIQFKMLRLHLDRIADIALSKQESNLQGQNLSSTVVGNLTLENISYSYDGKNMLLNNINLNVNAGDSIVLTGSSGSGKTTLMKIMLGLLKPSSGRVLLDGQDISNIGLSNYRKQVAAVMQNDALLTGTISDNISFFDPQPNLKRIAQCACLAAIDNEIENMTMGYNTLVGDMGSTLSGGQKQRLLLARALYQSPLILFLDEATSHLDKNNENLINSYIGNLSMTRITIAHRQETINAADKIYELTNGYLTPKHKH